MAIKNLMKGVGALVGQELARANRQFAPFGSKHEGYAVILEEVEEAEAEVAAMDGALRRLWEEVRGKGDAAVSAYLSTTPPAEQLEQAAMRLACEAVQVAAMCRKYRARECELETPEEGPAGEETA